MRIFHFILGKANKNRPNGVNQVIAGLCKYSTHNGAQVKVIGIANSTISEGEVVKREGFEVNVYSKWSRKLLSDLKIAIDWCDVVHLHGVYNIHNLLVSKIALRQSTPYIVTLHDGLSPIRAKNKRRLLKKIFHSLLQRSHLESATALHVLTNEESTDAIGICKPKELILIPNGIDLNDYILNHKNKTNLGTSASDRITIGYLGRISEEKNLSLLIDAVVSLRKKFDIYLKIAGPKSSYLDEIFKNDLASSVEWVGPQYGIDKINFIETVDLFVHPALCDVFSIVAMEVLAIGTPLLITRTSNSSYFFNRNAFFMCEPTLYGLKSGILDAINRRNQWPNIVDNGKLLVNDTFNWNTASKSLLSEYSRILTSKIH